VFCSCRVDCILAHPDVLSVTAFKMGVRTTPQGVSGTGGEGKGEGKGAGQEEEALPLRERGRGRHRSGCAYME
jgi:hypothetical protein